MTEYLADIVSRIARRDASRSEATLQADIRSFILAAALNLDANDLSEEAQTVAMEAQLGDGSKRRIDIEAGTTVIEVKKNLRVGVKGHEFLPTSGHFFCPLVASKTARIWP